MQYQDVETDFWGYSAIKLATEKGLIQGNNGVFNPNKPITRQDAAVILDRLSQIKNITVEEKSASKVFADEIDMSNYAKESVYNMSAINVITGYNDNTFGFRKNITRAESAVMIYRLLKLYWGF